MIVGGQPELAVLAEPFYPFRVPVLAVLCWQDPQCVMLPLALRALNVGGAPMSPKNKSSARIGKTKLQNVMAVTEVLALFWQSSHR